MSTGMSTVDWLGVVGPIVFYVVSLVVYYVYRRNRPSVSGLDSEAVHTLVLSYAFGGLGAALGPTLVAALWWKRVTVQGAVASMAVGTVSMLVWPQLPALLDSGAPQSGFWAEFVGVYGLFPAFVLSASVLVGVSLLTEPPANVEGMFDIFDKPIDVLREEDLSAYGFDTGADLDRRE